MAHVNGDDLDGVPPGRRCLGQPVRRVIGGAAHHLPLQPLIAGQAGKASVPPVREQNVLAGLRISAWLQRGMGI
jgi:hypothetical protein